MSTVRPLIPWVAGVAWGLVFAFLALAVPIIGAPSLIVVGLIAFARAVRSGRTLFLSGLLIGLGGTILVPVGLACQGTVACQRAESTPAFVAMAATLVIAGLVALRANRAT